MCDEFENIKLKSSALNMIKASDHVKRLLTNYIIEKNQIHTIYLKINMLIKLNVHSALHRVKPIFSLYSEN